MQKSNVAKMAGKQVMKIERNKYIEEKLMQSMNEMKRKYEASSSIKKI